MATFKDRLLEAMSLRNMKAIDISEITGISKARMSQYVNGVYTPKSKATYEIAKALNVSETWLMGLDTPMTRKPHFELNLRMFDKESPGDIAEPSNISNVIPAENLHMIPVFASVSAGFGAYASDEILEYIPTVLTNPYEANITLGIKVTGNSMYPKIEDGDTIVVRKQESVDSGSIAVILLDGEEGLVKKVKYGPDWIDLISINPEYPVKHFEGSEVQRLRVVGLVRQIIKMV